MKATVEPKALAAACKLTSAAAPTSPTMPVLAGALLTPTDAGLHLSAFNMETSVQTVVRTELVSDGDPVLVSHRLLTQISGVAGTKALELVDDGGMLLARSGRSEWRLPMMDVQVYPKLPKLPDPLGVVDGQVLADAVHDVSLAAATSESLPALTGILVEFTHGALQLLCTDRHRLHTATVPWKPVGDAGDHDPIVIPARTMRALTGFGRGDVELFADRNLFAASGDGTRFTTRMLDASHYPMQARSLIPAVERATTVVTVEPLMLAAAVRQVSIGASQNAPMQLSFTPGGGAALLSRDDHGNTAGTAEIDADVTGDPADFGFNAAYIQDLLGTFDDVVTARVVDSRTAVTFAAGDGDPQSLVMPVRFAGGPS